MTRTLVFKLFRDVRVALLVVALVLGAFQCLWAKIVENIIGLLQPVFETMAAGSGFSLDKVRSQVLFAGPAQAIRAMVGGDSINFERAQDLLSIALVHPVMVILFCIWGVGRAAGALAGELDRGTMELLLAQPVSRARLVQAHFLLDLITIPILCLSLWAGNALGVWFIGPQIKTQKIDLDKLRAEGDVVKPNVLVEIGPIKVSVPIANIQLPKTVVSGPSERLAVSSAPFGPPLFVVGGLIFAICGYTMWLSSMGRFRMRVLGIAILVTLIMFLINLLGQMWDVVTPLRPFTIFYYYQPQQIMQGRGWSVPLGGIEVPMLVVLYGVGVVGYGLALWTFCQRDLPAPL